MKRAAHLAAVWLLVCAAVMALRASGAFVRAELAAYDWLLRSRPAALVDARILIVDETEEDLQRYGHPLPDIVFVKAIEALLAQGAAVIGVDKYRDIPVPPGSAELEALLAARHNVVWAMLLGGPGTVRVQPPHALRGSARVGFSDIVDDEGGVVRRGLLHVDDGKTVSSAFPLTIAALYLARSKVAFANDPRVPEAIRVGPALLLPFEADDGGYVGADAAGFQLLLDFRGMPQRFAHVTLSELLDGRAGADVARGRVVLLGSSAHSLKDFFHTPYSSAGGAERITGVELHGHLVSQLLRLGLGESAPQRVLPEWGDRGALAAFAALGVAAFFLPALAAVAFLVAGCAAAFGIAWLAIQQGWWLPPVAPASALACGALAGVALRVAAERAERATLMALFARHVSPEVAALLWRERGALIEGGRLRPVELTATILFADIRGYTPVAQMLAPDLLARWLNEYMDAMSRAVMQHGGIVRQFAGDAVLAAFGAPIPHQAEAVIAADARNALRCALAMTEALAVLDRDWQARGLPQVGMRIGIQTGRVVACSVGTAQRLEYTLLGDVVNIAARLQSLGGDEERFRILAGEATFALAGADFECVPLGPVQLKGRSTPLNTYRIAGRRPGAGAATGPM
jgi:adenylate cyclase